MAKKRGYNLGKNIKVDGWFRLGFISPKDAAHANPELMSEDGGLWKPWKVGEMHQKQIFAMHQALLLLSKRELLFVNFKAQEFSIRQMARAAGIHRQTAQKELNNALAKLRETAERIYQASQNDEDLQDSH